MNSLYEATRLRELVPGLIAELTACGGGFIIGKHPLCNSDKAPPPRNCSQHDIFAGVFELAVETTQNVIVKERYAAVIASCKGRKEGGAGEGQE